MNIFAERLTIQGASASASITTVFAGDIKIDELEVHGFLSARRPYETDGGSGFVQVSDCGAIVMMATDNGVVQLGTLSDVSGCQVTIINTAADRAALLSVSTPAASSIYGACVGDASLSAGGATVVQLDGSALQNTKTTHLKGDYVTVASDGTDWFVIGCVGEWVSTP